MTGELLHFAFAKTPIGREPNFLKNFLFLAYLKQCHKVVIFDSMNMLLSIKHLLLG